MLFALNGNSSSAYSGKACMLALVVRQWEWWGEVMVASGVWLGKRENCLHILLQRDDQGFCRGLHGYSCRAFSKVWKGF